MPEIHKDRQHRGGEREIHINSGRDDKREEGAREKTRRDGERRGREKGVGGRERHRFSHVQTEGFEAFDPDPQTQVHLTKQVRLVFQAVSLPRSRRPGALIHSCPLCTMTFEPGKIIALEQITYNR